MEVQAFEPRCVASMHFAKSQTVLLPSQLSLLMNNENKIACGFAVQVSFRYRLKHSIKMHWI
jgi:hypothetical protein